MGFDLVHSKGKKKKRGSVTVVVLVLTGFLSIILTLFLNNAIDDLKYRQQMRSGTELRVEAYSFLDLALSFLEEYKKKDKVEKVLDNDPKVKKDAGKLIFDAEILGGDPENQDDDLISKYIVKKMGTKTATLSGRSKIENPTDQETDPKRIGKTLKHGNYMITYKFEDISAKIPLCKEFDKYSKTNSSTGDSSREGLISTIAHDTSISGVDKLKRHIDDNEGTFSKWETVEAVIRGSGSGSSSSGTVDLNELKKIFTIESCAIVAAGYNDSSKKSAKSANTALDKPGKFKINLLTAHKKIREAINKTMQEQNKSLPTEKKWNAYNFEKDLKNLKQYCSVEVSIFSLTVKVSTQNGNAFVLHCICDDTNATSSESRGSGDKKMSERLPFHIAKIEEF